MQKLTAIRQAQRAGLEWARRSMLFSRVSRVIFFGLAVASSMVGCGSKDGTSGSSYSQVPGSKVGVAGAATMPPPSSPGSLVSSGELPGEAPDAEIGRQVYVQTCATCHGFQAQGLPHQGAALRTSPFVAGHNDRDLVAFIKAGRPAKDANNVSGVAMPPRGNNAALSDARLADVVAYLRQVQEEARADMPANTIVSSDASSAVR